MIKEQITPITHWSLFYHKESYSYFIMKVDTIIQEMTIDDKEDLFLTSKLIMTGSFDIINRLFHQFKGYIPPCSNS